MVACGQARRGHSRGRGECLGGARSQDLSWSAETGLLAGRSGSDVVLWNPATALAIATADDTVVVLGADTGAELARLPVGLTIDTIAMTATTIAVGGHTGIAVLDLVLDPP